MNINYAIACFRDSNSVYCFIAITDNAILVANVKGGMFEFLLKFILFGGLL